MIPIPEHASEICKILEHTEEPMLWNNLGDWLTVASGIVSVRFNSIRFDDNFGWCSSADEFNQAREQLFQQCVSELTRFTYCWGALECAIDIVDPIRAPQPGKINNAAYYIGNRSPQDRGFPLYSDVLGRFRQILIDELPEEKNILSRFEAPPFVPFRALGMYVIYCFRNQFAHGALDFPLPDPENQPNNPYTQLIPLASRLVLLSIQHLLAATHKEHTETWIDFVKGEEEEREFHSYLRSLHLERPTDDHPRLF